MQHNQATTLTLALILLTGGLVATAPMATASYSDIKEYTNHAIIASDPDGVIAGTSFTYPTVPHGFTVTARRTVLEFVAGITTDTAAIGTDDDYTILTDINEGAATRITCGYLFSRDTAGGRMQFHDAVFCTGTALVPGTSYTYATRVVMGAGDTNRITDATYSWKFTQTDTVTDPTVDDVNAQALIDRVNVNANTNTTVTAARDVVTTAITALQTFISTQGNATWSRWDSGMNRLHLQTRATPHTSRGFENKGGYGYFYPGDDTGTSIDATDYGLYVPWDPRLDMDGNLSITANIIPEEVVVGTGGDAALDPPFLADFRSTGANIHWQLRLLHGDAVASPCEDGEWSLQYAHGTSSSTVITATDCYTYYEPGTVGFEAYGIAVQRDTFNKTITFSVNGVIDGPFTYVTQPSTTETHGFLVIGPCQPTATDLAIVGKGVCGDVPTSDDYRGNITEVRLWDHADLTMTDLTAIADPADATKKFCPEGTELALYFLEPYFVPQGTQCTTIDTAAQLATLNVTFTGNVTVNNTGLQEFIEAFFADMGNNTDILSVLAAFFDDNDVHVNTAEVATSVNLFFWLALIALSCWILWKQPFGFVVSPMLGGLIGVFALFYSQEVFAATQRVYVFAISLIILVGALMTGIGSRQNESEKRERKETKRRRQLDQM